VAQAGEVQVGQIDGVHRHRRLEGLLGQPQTLGAAALEVVQWLVRVLGQAADAVRRAVGGRDSRNGSGRGGGNHEEEQGQPGGQVGTLHGCEDGMWVVCWQWILLTSSLAVLAKKQKNRSK